MNELRHRAALAALLAHKTAKADDPNIAPSDALTPEAVIDLLADLQHLSNANGLWFSRCAQLAREHVAAETAE
jgi:hypothetical protein